MLAGQMYMELVEGRWIAMVGFWATVFVHQMDAQIDGLAAMHHEGRKAAGSMLCSKRVTATGCKT